MNIFKEKLNGVYDAIVPSHNLPKGAVSDGSNMRKANVLGGWKPRKGCTVLNTTPAGSDSKIISMHQYTNPTYGDYHLICQFNNDLQTTATAGNVILTESGVAISTENGEDIESIEGTAVLDQRATLGSSILASGVTVGPEPGFSTLGAEDLIYADGSGPPITFGGDAPYCIGLTTYIDAGGGDFAYTDFTKEVTDGSSSTYAVLSGGGSSDVYYVCSSERAAGVQLKFGSTVNGASALTVCTVYAWRSGAWADASATDGTKTTYTHDTDGSITWARNANDSMRVINGTMGYWYKFTFTGGGDAIDAVELISCRVIRAGEYLTSKWDGVYEYPTGILFYDQSAGTYTDVLADLTDGATTTYLDLNAATASDKIFIKTPVPATGFGFAMVPGSVSTADAQINQVLVYEAHTWDGASGIVDETLDSAGDTSFSTTGTVWFDAAAMSPVMRGAYQGDNTPGYWYRIGWDAAMSAEDVFIYEILYAAYPTTLPTYRGAIEFDGRIYLWGDPTYPNRLRYSAEGTSDVFDGSDSGYTNRFGTSKEPILLVVRLYENLIVFKRKGIWTFSTAGVVNQIADRVGIAGLKTAQIVEIGLSGMKRDELVSILIWAHTDGVYVLDGVKPKKVSGPIDNYFDPEYSDVIPAIQLNQLESFKDTTKYEYHLLTPTIELVYNYKTDEWYPSWTRELPLTCGLNLDNYEGRPATLGGTDIGFILLLENDTSDKTAANVDAAISHYITTRSIAALPEESTVFRFTLRGLWAEFAARSSGSVTVYYTKILSSGETSIGTMSISNASAEMALGFLDLSLENVVAVSFKFSSTTLDQQMEVWAISYSVDAVGEVKV